MDEFKPLLDAIAAAKKPVFFTGAGVSTLCGIPDFRGPSGIYRDPDAARMFEIDLFDDDPSFFYRHADALVYGGGMELCFGSRQERKAFRDVRHGFTGA